MGFIVTPSAPGYGGGDRRSLEGLENGGRGPLRHFLVGSPQRIRATIRHLQALRYVDCDRWTNLLAIDSTQGLIIRPTLREMYAYLELPLYRD